MKRRHLVLVFGLFLSHSYSQAMDGSNGCGPAWYILKDTSLVSSFLREVTNNFLFPVVTFGMSSGTSNCAKHSIVEDTRRSEHLLAVSFDKLRQDAARGEGRFLEAYAATFKCDASSTQQFNATIQKNYAAVFGQNASPEMIVDQTKAVLRRDPSLASQCDAA